MSSTIDKLYISPIDIKLAEFNATHKPSKAQIAEIVKYERIDELRDNMLLESGCDAAVVEMLD